GGLLVDLGGWRTTFAINVPVALACLALGWRALPRGPGRTAAATASTDAPVRRARLDIAGVLLFATMLIALMLALTGTWWLLAAAVAAGAGFAWWERRHASPFIDVRVLVGNLPLLATYARNTAAYVVFYAFVYGFTQWVQQGRGLSASAAGLILLPAFGVGMAVTAITGRKAAVRAKLAVGSAVQVVVCVLLLTLGAD